MNDTPEGYDRIRAEIYAVQMAAMDRVDVPFYAE